MKAFKTMLKIESKLSLRGYDMLIFAIGMPLVMTIIIGIIYGTNPAYDGSQYSFLEQSFGAISTIALCAGGVMGLPLVISEYRYRKILKRFKVTPVSPTMLLFVQVTIYMLYSVASLILVYACANIFFGLHLTGSLFGFLGSYILVMAAMFSLGMLVGGLAKNAKVSNILCSLLYFPMLIFSGATLPYEVMPASLQSVADFMPLTQGIKLLKATSLGLPIDNVLFAIIILVSITIICAILSIRFFRWE